MPAIRRIKSGKDNADSGEIKCTQQEALDEYALRRKQGFKDLGKAKTGATLLSRDDGDILYIIYIYKG